jgi:hypothetical protein
MTRSSIDELIEKLSIAKEEMSLATAKVNEIIHTLKILGLSKEEINVKLTLQNKSRAVKKN